MRASRNPTTEVEPLEYKRTQYGYLTIGSLLVIVAILVGVIVTAVDPGGRIVLNILVTGFTLIGLLLDLNLCHALVNVIVLVDQEPTSCICIHHSLKLALCCLEVEAADYG